ncbi:MAG TPA: hypothetical protein VML01_13290 [Bryobacterales bacterium]|nr:hypothetical protein [Bryobacterales bacterium]
MQIIRFPLAGNIRGARTVGYRYSDLDRKNLRLFSKDTSRATLMTIQVVAGQLRGLGDVRLDMAYPITAIAGRNGTGKSTLLALAACAFHNDVDGFNPLNRKNPYYTFSDFFIQDPEEISPAGIGICYQINHDKWLRGSSGPGWQARMKRRAGRWTNYDRRVDRNVVFLGHERVVPHSERSVSKSYRRRFRNLPQDSCADQVCQISSRIVGKRYEKLWYKGHARYRLPMATDHRGTYSGFNMGAGESAVYEILSTICGTDKSLLVVIDEIELGLHEDAQAKLIDELKTLCAKRRLQVICSPILQEYLRAYPQRRDSFLNARRLARS